jgi:hypothetical protein
MFASAVLSGQVLGAAGAANPFVMSSAATAIVATSVMNIIFFVRFFIIPSFRLGDLALARSLGSHDAMPSKWNVHMIMHQNNDCEEIGKLFTRQYFPLTVFWNFKST